MSIIKNIENKPVTSESKKKSELKLIDGNMYYIYTYEKELKNGKKTTYTIKVKKNKKGKVNLSDEEKKELSEKRKAYQKLYREKNKEKIKTRQKKYRGTHKISKKYFEEYRKNNRDKINKYNLKYYYKNRDKILSRQREIYDGKKSS